MEENGTDLSKEKISSDKSEEIIYNFAIIIYALLTHLSPFGVGIGTFSKC